MFWVCCIIRRQSNHTLKRPSSPARDVCLLAAQCLQLSVPAWNSLRPCSACLYLCLPRGFCWLLYRVPGSGLKSNLDLICLGVRSEGSNLRLVSLNWCHFPWLSALAAKIWWEQRDVSFLFLPPKRWGGLGARQVCGLLSPAATESGNSKSKNHHYLGAAFPQLSFMKHYNFPQNWPLCRAHHDHQVLNKYITIY